MIACGQCFVSLAQAIAIGSSCLIPIILNSGKLFKKEKENSEKTKEDS
jgi:hypothetical protein